MERKKSISWQKNPHKIKKIKNEQHKPNLKGGGILRREGTPCTICYIILPYLLFYRQWLVLNESNFT